jgi:hypothetical protein
MACDFSARATDGACLYDASLDYVENSANTLPIGWDLYSIHRMKTERMTD